MRRARRGRSFSAGLAVPLEKLSCARPRTRARASAPPRGTNGQARRRLAAGAPPAGAPASRSSAWRAHDPLPSAGEEAPPVADRRCDGPPAGAPRGAVRPALDRRDRRGGSAWRAARRRTRRARSVAGGGLPWHSRWVPAAGPGARHRSRCGTSPAAAGVPVVCRRSPAHAPAPRVARPRGEGERVRSESSSLHTAYALRRGEVHGRCQGSACQCAS